ncbi:MAG TPA: STAS domain-containing protein [Anaerolineales bacterium]
MMQLEFSELDGTTRLLRLSGRLDIVGTGEIETRFAGYCAVNECRVLVDLAGVDFLASIGIRLLVINAKSVINRGGRMLIVNPSSDVRHVLDISGIPPIIPIYDNLESARAASLVN